MLNYLPEFNISRNSFDQLHIDSCEWIKTNGGGWIGRDNANTIGKKIYHRPIKTYMYIDNFSYKTLDDRLKFQ